MEPIFSKHFNRFYYCTIDGVVYVRINDYDSLHNILVLFLLILVSHINWWVNLCYLYFSIYISHRILVLNTLHILLPLKYMLLVLFITYGLQFGTCWWIQLFLHIIFGFVLSDAPTILILHFLIVIQVLLPLENK